MPIIGERSMPRRFCRIPTAASSLKWRVDRKPHIKNLAPLIGVMTVTMLMLGCSSGAQMPSMGAAQSQGHAGVTQPLDRTAQLASPNDNGGCQNSDGVDVTPCRVVFNANHPGPTTVKVHS